MKETKETLIHQLTRKALYKAIRHTADIWPPFSTYGFYQPHRPDKPLHTSKKK